MLIRIGYEMIFQVPAPAPMVLMLSLRPERLPTVRRTGGTRTDPGLPIERYRDGFGNDCVRILAPPGKLRIWDDTVVEDPGTTDEVAPDAEQWPVEALPSDALGYLLGSRYCEVDRLSQAAWDLFGTIPNGWGKVQAVCDWVHNNVRFGYEFARPTKTAYEVFEERSGVCRDFTHLALSFCRCLNIPARYLSGYLGDVGVPPQPFPMDFSGWFEVFLGGRWYTFDARHNTPRIGRIVMARGRDAVDVALTTSFGPTTLERFAVWTEEVREEMLAFPLAPPVPEVWIPGARL